MDNPYLFVYKTGVLNLGFRRIPYLLSNWEGVISIPNAILTTIPILANTFDMNFTTYCAVLHDDKTFLTPNKIPGSFLGYVTVRNVDANYINGKAIELDMEHHWGSEINMKHLQKAGLYNADYDHPNEWYSAHSAMKAALYSSGLNYVVLKE